MPIPSSNLPAVMFLLELDIQCKLIELYSNKLEQASAHWIQFEHGIDDDLIAPPIDMVAECMVCLSAMAAVRRLLFTNNNKESVKKRCRLLMKLLGNPSLPYLSSATVRNSWEHFDERLDDLLCIKHPEYISPIYVSSKPPAADTVALRRFDPIEFAINFADESVLLRPCIEEMKLLKTCIRNAFVTLQHNPSAS